MADKKIKFSVFADLHYKYMMYAPTACEMAKKLNMSYSNMSRILSETLRLSYSSLLNSIRIENAKKLLATTEKSITEICFGCGFQNCSYFIKTFKKSVGITPYKYRAQINIRR